MKLSIITATRQRAKKLQTLCLPSILGQTVKDFEWIVINDGKCPETREIMESVKDQMTIQYFETAHQGLIASRNLGLENAKGELIGFLDDDNVLYTRFVAQILHFFETHSKVKMCNPIRQQRRDVYKDGECIRTGKTFYRPDPQATGEDFVKNNSKAWFDSNGFVHRRNDALRFNPNVLIMSDYEYLLQAFSLWGPDALKVLEEELILYVQTNEGIIGQSNFYDWLKDFEYIQANQQNYAIFQQVNPEPWLSEQTEEIRAKAVANKALPGFPREL